MSAIRCRAIYVLRALLGSRGQPPATACSRRCLRTSGAFRPQLCASCAPASHLPPADVRSRAAPFSTFSPLSSRRRGNWEERPGEEEAKAENKPAVEDFENQRPADEQEALSVFGKANLRLLNGTHPASARMTPQRIVRQNAEHHCSICNDKIRWESNATLKWSEGNQEYYIANAESCARCDPEQAATAALLLSVDSDEMTPVDDDQNEVLDFRSRDEDLHGKDGMTQEEFDALLEWLEIPGNFEKVEDISQQSKPGTWRAMSDHITDRGGRPFISLRMFALYADYMARYQRAFRAIKRGTISEKQLEELCPNFRRLHKLYGGMESVVTRKLPFTKRPRPSTEQDSNEPTDIRMRAKELSHVEKIVLAKHRHELMLTLIKSERPVQELVVLYNLFKDQM